MKERIFGKKLFKTIDTACFYPVISCLVCQILFEEI